MNERFCQQITSILSGFINMHNLNNSQSNVLSYTVSISLTLHTHKSTVVVRKSVEETHIHCP